MSFLDHFSKQSATYAAFRPRYPRALFTFLAGVVPGHDLALDVACGNGQASLDLAEFFKRVVATDASQAQIAHAMPHPKISYEVRPAEASGLGDGCVDLVTVAQAAHWLPRERFYAEVKRVLKPGGVIALWCYERDWQVDVPIERLLLRYSDEIVGAYWPPEIQLVWDRYQTLDFPFSEIDCPIFSVALDWNLEMIVGYLLSWSSTQKYLERHGKNPVEEILPELEAEWGNPADLKRFTWQIYARIGKLFR